MSARIKNYNVVAGGTISPRTLLKLSTSADNKVVAATANAKIIGVAPDFTRTAPGFLGSDDTVAFNSGDPVNLPDIGEIVPVLAGGTITRDLYIESDGSGAGISSVTSGQRNVAGRSLTACASGEVFYMLFNPQQITN